MASDFDLQAGSVGMTLDEVRERYGRHYWIESEWTTEAGVTTRNSTVGFRAVCAEDALKQFRERAPESNMRVVSVKPCEDA